MSSKYTTPTSLSGISTGVFDELINLVLKDFEPDDMIGIQLSQDGLDRVTLYIPPLHTS